MTQYRNMTILDSTVRREGRRRNRRFGEGGVKGEGTLAALNILTWLCLGRAWSPWLGHCAGQRLCVYERPQPFTQTVVLLRVHWNHQPDHFRIQLEHEASQRGKKGRELVRRNLPPLLQVMQSPYCTDHNSSRQIFFYSISEAETFCIHFYG